MTSRSWGELKKTADDASRPLPKDWYDIMITKCEATTASTGSPMLKVQMKVVGGPYNNRMLFTNFVLSLDNSVALSIFFRNMAAFGLDDAFFASLAGADSDPAIGMQTVAATLIGRTARAEVGTRTWQGQERNEVMQVTKPQSGIGTPMTGSTNMGMGIVPNAGITNASQSVAPVIPTVPAVPVTHTAPAVPQTTAPQVDDSPWSITSDAPPPPPAF